uniref:Uncharacterized protein n=1 Tax=Meloidogyne enterolobii TaxID=390850 RepID=A0A6V7Y6Z4_MELEN|nr:unnamed protein product [Meloidogyne enterolobii]
MKAQKIPFVDELPIECIELALLFEHVFEDFCYPQKDMPFQNWWLARIRSNEDDGGERETKRTRQNTQSIEDMLNNDQYWLMLNADRQIAANAASLMNNLKGINL